MARAGTRGSAGRGAALRLHAGNEASVAFEEEVLALPPVCCAYNRGTMPLPDEPLRSELSGIEPAGTRGPESVSNAMTWTIGGLPSAGGGGGPKDHDWWFWTKGGTIGLDQKLVVGESLTAVAGMRQFLGLGSDLQVKVNPTALQAFGATVPESVKLLAGAGYGGALNMTLGTNTTITLGGPNIAVFDSARMDVNLTQILAVPRVICGLIALLVVLWEVCYACLPDAKARTKLFAACETLLSLLLIALLRSVQIKNFLDASGFDYRVLLFGGFGWVLDLSPRNGTTALAGLAVVAETLVTPILMGAIVGAGADIPAAKPTKPPDTTDDTRPGGGDGTDGTDSTKG